MTPEKEREARRGGIICFAIGFALTALSVGAFTDSIAWAVPLALLVGGAFGGAIYRRDRR